MTFGETLKAFRLRANLSGSQLAFLASVDASYISRLEADKREPPREEVMNALCRALRLRDGDVVAFWAASGKVSPLVARLVGNTTIQAVAEMMASLPAQERIQYEYAILALTRGWRLPEGEDDGSTA